MKDPEGARLYFSKKHSPLKVPFCPKARYFALDCLAKSGLSGIKAALIGAEWVQPPCHRQGG